MQFDGKVAVITGGSSGIGRATAIKFAALGAKVVLAARGEERGEAVATEIRETGGKAIFVRTDVTVESEVESLVREAVEAFGSLDIAFNNAGLWSALGPTHEIDEESWDRELAVNLKGVWLCLKHEVIQMLQHGGGAIVNDSSAGGLKGAASAAAYSDAKHGVIGLTRSAAVEYGARGIRVNAVCPGFIATPMTQFMSDDPETISRVVSAYPVGRVGNPEEIANAVTWLCSEDAAFVTGIAMPVDGGFVAK